MADQPQYPWGNRRSGLREWLFGPRKSKPAPPICADTEEPKDPRGCWNVRCQLGGTCCRADGVQVALAPAELGHGLKTGTSTTGVTGGQGETFPPADADGSADR